MSGPSRPDAAPRILVVDDDPVNRKVAAAILGRLGFAADVAPDGASGLDAALTGAHDLLLVDCQMPVMGGLELTRRLRVAESESGRPRLTVIAMSGAVSSEDRTRCLDAGVDDVVVKPLSRDLLRDLLDRWMVVAGSAAAAPAYRSDPGAGGELRSAVPVAAPSIEPDLAVAPVASFAEPPPVRLERLESIVGRERATLRNYLMLFANVADQLVADLSAAVVAGNAAEARRAAHQLKGSALSIGADALGAAAARAEHFAADAGACGQDGAAIAADVAHAYERVRAFILAV